MDKYTFMDSPSAKNLVKILDDPQYKQYSSKIKRTLSKYFSYTAYVMYIPNKTVRDATLKFWKEHFEEIINYSEIPVVIVTHSFNVMTARYRECLKETKPRAGNYKTIHQHKTNDGEK